MAITKNKVVLFLLIVFLILCFLGANQSLWLDEAIGAIAAKDYSYSGIAYKFLLADNHPPLYYMLLKFWTSFFGFSDIAIRSLSILAGSLTIYITYKLAFLINNKKVNKIAILTVLLMATSQFFIYFSQEARMYIFTALFSSIAFYSYLNTLKKNENKKYWLGFSLSIAILMFMDYMPVFLLPVFWIYPIFKKQSKTWWRNFILSHISLLILFIFWGKMFLTQVEIGKFLIYKFPQWHAVAGGASVKNALLVWFKFTLGRVSMFNKPFYYGLVGLASLPFLFAFKNVIRKKYLLLIFWIIVPLLLGFFASVYFPAFNYFRFVYVVPAFYLLTAIGLLNIDNKLLRKSLITLLIVINIGSWSYYMTNKDQQREDWKDATAYIDSLADPQAIALFEFPAPFAPYKWYSKGLMKAEGATNSVSADKNQTIEFTRNLIKGRNIVYLFDYLRDLSDFNRYVESTLKDNHFEVILENANFPGVGKITKWQRKQN